ncbi:ABC-type Fe3+-hydroxamate transport system, periplasmic component [Desulfomonile tiedjei DSM 6799]|uniref:ABC-type Fe3+-hydroxamate transport system, periplasmic component n=2 Tax=Desulfomonile tiedjei TaxID=2358 RepID=I4CER2_DESTA|nr:ABC-type Fe3+-hydroxamate transport system, periplasmic component [Desulfomonile tiedjei DSM 6799]
MRCKEGIASGLCCLLLFSTWTVYAETLTYTDKLGRTVDVPLPIKRAVFFETYELVAHLGIWDRMVGISRYAYENDLMRAVNPDIERTIPSAGSGLDVNIEALLKLNPDLVLTWTYKPDIVPFMERKGLTVIAIYLESIAELYEVMRLQGRLFQKEEQVQQSIILMERIFDLIRERVSAISDSEKKKVLWLGRSPTTVAGRTGIPHDTFMMIRGENVAASIHEENTEVSMEQIIAWNPEVIFIWGGAQYKSKDIMDSDQWRHVTAVKQGRVFKAPHWSRWSPRLALVALWMAKRTYPEHFRDVNLEAVTESFFQKLYGISYQSLNSIED